MIGGNAPEPEPGADDRLGSHGRRLREASELEHEPRVARAQVTREPELGPAVEARSERHQLIGGRLDAEYRA